MAEQDDSERLIAEALRAQASRTPLPDGEATQGRAGPGLGLAGGGYGLLSGEFGQPAATPQAPTPPEPGPRPATPQARAPQAGTAQEEQEETARVSSRPGQTTRRIESDRPVPVPVPAILLLAVLLGLAAGAVAGLLTLL